MADVNISADILAVSKSLLPNGRRHRDVAVETDEHFVSVRGLPKALERGYGQFPGNGPSSQRLGEHERVIEFVVGRSSQPVELDDFDGHASIFIFLAKILGLAHGKRQSPLA